MYTRFIEYNLAPDKTLRIPREKKIEDKVHIGIAAYT